MGRLAQRDKVPVATRTKRSHQAAAEYSVVELVLTVNGCSRTSIADWSKLHTVYNDDKPRTAQWTDGRVRRWRPVKLHL